MISIKNKNRKFKRYLKIPSDAPFEEYRAYKNKLNSILDMQREHTIMISLFSISQI